MAYETPLTIREVVQEISAKKYILPSIQREFIWSKEQIEKLFDSLMQDYPIGTFLFWDLPQSKYNDYEFYEFLQNYHQRNARHNPKINLNGSENVMAVLDGQQRLTSLFIGLKGTYADKLPRFRWKNDDAFPKRKLYLNIIEPSDKDGDRYDFRFLTDDEVKKAAEIKDNPSYYWFEVGEILNMQDLGAVMKYVNKNIYKNAAYNEDQGDFAMDCMSQLYNVIHTQPIVSYYRVKDEELDKVLNIFIRVNSGGTPLSYSDLLLSIATAQWESLDAREEITELVDELNSIGGGFHVNKDFVLKSALVLTGFKKIQFKVDNFNKKNLLEIEENWKNIRNALYLAFSLVSSLGFNRDSLTANYAVIPIAYYLEVIGMPSNFVTSTAQRENRQKIKQYLIRALVKRAFGGQPDVVLRPISDVIIDNGTDEFPLEAIIERLRKTSKSLVFNSDDIDMLLETKYGKPDSYTALMLLYPHVDFSYKFHVDHMYPKSKFKRKTLLSKGVKAELIDEYLDQVNNIANLQLLPAVPNMEKQSEDFDIWFQKEYSDESAKINYRMLNYMPDMEYSYPNFLTFVGARRELMKKRFEKLLLEEIDD